MPRPAVLWRRTRASGASSTSTCKRCCHPAASPRRKRTSDRRSAACGGARTAPGTSRRRAPPRAAQSRACSVREMTTTNPCFFPRDGLAGGRSIDRTDSRHAARHTAPRPAAGRACYTRALSLTCVLVCVFGVCPRVYRERSGLGRGGWGAPLRAGLGTFSRWRGGRAPTARHATCEMTCGIKYRYEASRGRSERQRCTVTVRQLGTFRTASRVITLE